MRKVLMAGAAAISLSIMPAVAIAQANVPGSTNSVDDKRPYDMTEEQQGMYDTWPADRQAEYNSLPNDQKLYFWSLDSAKQEGYWALTPEQRMQIAQMTPEQQEQAWASIAAQMSGQTATPPATTMPAEPMSGMDDTDGGMTSPADSAMAPTGGAMPSSASTTPSGATTRYISNATVQGGMTTPTPQADYPVCKGEVQDSCINPGAK